MKYVLGFVDTCPILEFSIKICKTKIHKAVMVKEQSDEESTFVLKEIFRPIVLMFVENANQSSINILYSLTSKFIHSRFFINEIVSPTHKNGLSYIVTDIKAISGPSSPSDGCVYDPANIEYTLRKIAKPDAGSVCIASATQMKRPKRALEGLYTFLKENVIYDGVYRVNPHSYKKYVTDKNLTFSKVFIGSIPQLCGARVDASIKAEAMVLGRKCDDLQRSDQKPLPLYETVKTSIPSEYFGDVLMICEFLYSFSKILSDTNPFESNNYLSDVTRALTQNEMNGPLNTIVISLLKTIFELQVREESNSPVKYVRSGNTAFKWYKVVNNAYNTHKYVNEHFLANINELPLDTYTVSEVLRLHLLSSGAKVHFGSDMHRQTNRNGYSTLEDPGLDFCKQHPDVLEHLKTISIFQLPMSDLIPILKTLIAQILTYNPATELAEEISKHVPDSEDLLQYDNLNSKQTLTRSKIKDGKKVPDGNVYLGMDRAYRKYYVLRSVPGVFVEHPSDTPSECLDNPPKNTSDLINCPKVTWQIEKYLRKLNYEKLKNQLEHPLLDQNDHNHNTTNEDNVTESHACSVEMNNNSVAQKREPSVIARDLFMCTGDPRNCIVHDIDHPDRQNWAFFYKAEDIDAVIDGLNSLGNREGELKNNLKLLRDLIVQLTKNCPVDNLSLDASTIKKQISAATSSLSDPMDVPMVLSSTLANHILNLENQITAADIGKLKVEDLQKWRDSVIESSKTDSLSRAKPKYVEFALINKNGVTYTNLHSDKDLNENIASTSPSSNFQCIHNLASALLQVERSLHQKYIVKTLPNCLEMWEKSLMKATSFSEVFLHLKILHTAIEWKFLNNTNRCTICRGVLLDEDKILCTKCETGAHMSCLKIRSKVTRSTVWYCDQCTEENRVEKSLKRRLDGFEYRLRSKIRK